MDNQIKVIKRDGTHVPFSYQKIENVLVKAFKATGEKVTDGQLRSLLTHIHPVDMISVENIQTKVQEALMQEGFYKTAAAYIKYRSKRSEIRDFVDRKIDFINRYKKSNNTANATVDDNSNVSSKNVGVLNAEIHKEDNIQISRGMIVHKLRELYPDFDAKQYLRDLESHVIYKHDESSFAGAIASYCCSISMYPFLLNGLKEIGGLSAAPKNLDSFCGLFVNLLFAVSAQFAGAVATSEFLLYFDYFCRKEWGNNYYQKHDIIITNEHDNRKRTIQKQIHQYFQQVVYSANQPAAARGMQAVFWNVSYFDKPFFEAMFGNFYFPDGTQPKWESLSWLQKDFMQWFNEERLKCIITFPVESFALIYKDGKFVDEDSTKFVAEEYARGHSFFTYISDTADSLSSCCRLKNKVTTHEFSFTNGNMGVETGSKSVISLNLSRIIQDWYRTAPNWKEELTSYGRANISSTLLRENYPTLKVYLQNILDRVYKYHTAYNELLWDMYDVNILPIYKAGFISLNKQYLTIGINGLNQAAEFLGIKCNDNEKYQKFCQFIFSTIKEYNTKHNGKFNGHTITFNTECVPAESLAIKNYNWDKADEYWVPEDINLYASYIFKPNDDHVSVLEKIRLHGKNYIGDYLDGGAAAHLNLSEHLSVKQYEHILEYAAKNGCQYFTFNIPNSECQDCGFITKHPIDKCPRCSSTHISYYDRIIGYLTKISNWSDGRQKEQKLRIYETVNKS